MIDYGFREELEENQKAVVLTPGYHRSFCPARITHNGWECLNPSDDRWADNWVPVPDTQKVVGIDFPPLPTF